MKIDMTHIVWPGIADRAGFFWTRFEVDRDGKTANERLKGKSAKVHGMSFADGVFRVGGPLGKSTCMWEDDVYLGIEDTTWEVVVGNRNTVGQTRTVLRKTAPDNWERSHSDMIKVLPWCTNEDDENTGGERHEGEVALMDKEKSTGKRWKWKNMSPAPRRVY